MQGNQKADALTKRGTESEFIALEPFLGILEHCQMNYIKLECSYTGDISPTGLIHLKALRLNLSMNGSSQIREWTRNDLRVPHETNVKTLSSR